VAIRTARNLDSGPAYYEPRTAACPARRVLPVASAVLTLFWPNIRAVVALTSLNIVIVDPLVMDRCYKVLTKRAAKIAEQFDYKVLDIPWDYFTVGDMLEAEDTHAAARSYAKRHDDNKLSNWYPTIVGSAPSYGPHNMSTDKSSIR
jgi:SMODS-associating 4TM effector domain